MNGVGVGLYGHERQDADLFFNQWGFDLLRLIIVEPDSSWNWMNKNVIRK